MRKQASKLEYICVDSKIGATGRRCCQLILAIEQHNLLCATAPIGQPTKQSLGPPARQLASQSASQPVGGSAKQGDRQAAAAAALSGGIGPPVVDQQRRGQPGSAVPRPPACVRACVRAPAWSVGRSTRSAA
eukprot:GHVU01029942.1.p1 GENE.GHVU01029942.1~~GHVU01029942.1.p1  ORF type:complete len:132 (-),score=18.24 GHVU01029942.1:12-407(-)